MIGWQLGVLVAAFVTPALLPLIGWRGMFVIGLLPALVAFVVRRALDEPEIFVRKHVAQQDSFRLLVKDGRTRKMTVGIATLCGIGNFGYYGIMIWMPSYLSSNLGFSLTRSATWTATIVLGMCCGLIGFGQLGDRIGRKPVFGICHVGAIVTLNLYSRITDPHTLLWVGAVMGMFVNGWYGNVGALMSEAYPTAARATAQNLLHNFGRGVASLAPLVVGALATKYSFSAAIALLSSIYVVGVVATVFLVPELKGKELD